MDPKLTGRIRNLIWSGIVLGSPPPRGELETVTRMKNVWNTLLLSSALDLTRRKCLDGAHDAAPAPCSQCRCDCVSEEDESWRQAA